MRNTTLRFPALILLTAFALLLTACEDKKRRITWSPDGQTATVIAGTTLYLTDEVGELSESLLQNVDLAEWVGNNQLLVLKKRKVEWEDSESVLGKESYAKIFKMSEQFIFEAKALEDPDDIDELVEEYPLIDLLPCLSRQFRDELLSLFKSVDSEKDENDLTKELDEYSAFEASSAEIYQWNGQNLTDPRRIGKSLLFNDIMSGSRHLRVSPDGRFAALTSDEGLDKGLWILQLSAPFESIHLESKVVANYPDWMPDGNSLVYIKGTGGSPEIGALVEQKLVDENGKLAPESPEKLASTVYFDDCRVRCLNDRRILMAAPELRLPAGLKDVPKTDQLFQLDPRHPGVITRVLPASTLAELPDSISCFELSPDKSRILIAGTGTSAIYIVELSGEHTSIQSENQGKLRWMPSWRSDDQICLVENDESGTAQVTLRSGESSVSLSEGWSPEIRKALTKQPGD